VWSFELKIIGSNSFYDDDLKGLMGLIAERKIKPVIDKVLPLDEAKEGLRLIQDREVIGKVWSRRDPFHQSSWPRLSRPSMPFFAKEQDVDGRNKSGHDSERLSGAGARPMNEELTAERVQELIGRAPYHQWLGLKVVAVHEDGIELTASWREEWVVNPDRRYTHGGVLAALIDLAADWAMVRRTGRGVPTIDLRVDYHAAAMPGDLTARGKVIRFGGQFSTPRRRCSMPAASSSRAAAAPISRHRRRPDSRHARWRISKISAT